MLVIGRPTRTPGRNVIKLDTFDEFVATLEGEDGLTIVIVPEQWPRE